MTGTQTSESLVDTIECPNCGARNRVPAAQTGVAHCGRCHHPLPWVTTAGDQDFEQVVVESTLPVLLDLWAPWCAPCRIVDPGVQQAAQTYAGRLKAVKVNVDSSPDVARRFEARSIPMILILHKGEVHRQQVGALAPGPLVEWVGGALERS
jgi:thioredoxin 2